MGTRQVITLKAKIQTGWCIRTSPFDVLYENKGKTSSMI
jgi:hypothetical protein